MKCVQQFTQLIKVPTGDYVQGKSNYQNEKKWLGEEKRWWSAARGEVGPNSQTTPLISVCHLSSPPAHRGQHGDILTHRLQFVCRKAAWISPSPPPFFLTVSCPWLPQFKPTENTPSSSYWKCQKPGSSFRNHKSIECILSIKAMWEEVRLDPVANIIIHDLCWQHQAIPLRPDSCCTEPYTQSSNKHTVL